MINKRKIYLDLFNLNENASKNDIKKRFRELAKIYHPDHNKQINSHDLFLKIREAYDYLINNDISQNKKINYYKEFNLEKERFDKIKKAKDNLNKYHKKRQIQIENEIKKYFNSLHWKIFKIISYISILITILTIFDGFLKPTKIRTIVNEISEEYNGYNSEKIILFRTNNNDKIFINHSIQNFIKNNDSIIIYKSKIFKKPYYIFINENTLKIKYDNFKNTKYYNLIISLFLIIPFIMLLYKERNLFYIFISKITLNINLFIYIYLILKTIS